MTQQLTSAKLGLIKYDDNDIINFSTGLLGFEGLNQYLLIKNEGSDIFLFLQSIEEPGLCFILIDPKSVLPTYELCVDEASLVGMEDKHIWDFAIVTIPEDPQGMAMNLLGPVLIDIKNQIGKQVISLKPEYTTKHKILAEEIKEAI